MKLLTQQMNKVLSVYMRLIQAPGSFGVIRFCPASLVGVPRLSPPPRRPVQQQRSAPLHHRHLLRVTQWGPAPFRHSIKYDWIRDQNKINICLRIGDYNCKSRRQTKDFKPRLFTHLFVNRMKWNTSVLHSAYYTVPTILLWNSI